MLIVDFRDPLPQHRRGGGLNMVRDTYTRFSTLERLLCARFEKIVGMHTGAIDARTRGARLRGRSATRFAFYQIKLSEPLRNGFRHLRVARFLDRVHEFGWLLRPFQRREFVPPNEIRDGLGDDAGL